MRQSNRFGMLMMKMMLVLFLMVTVIGTHAEEESEGSSEQEFEDLDAPPVLDIRGFFIGEWVLEVMTQQIDGELSNRSVYWNISEIDFSSVLRGNSSDRDAIPSLLPILLDFPEVIIGQDGKPIEQSSSRRGAWYASTSSSSVFMLPHLAAQNTASSKRKEWNHVFSFYFRLFPGNVFYSSGSFSGEDAHYQMLITNPNGFIMNIVEKESASSHRHFVPPTFHFIVATRLNPISAAPSFLEQYRIHATIAMIIVYQLYSSRRRQNTNAHNLPPPPSPSSTGSRRR